jgi:Zn-dependent protease
MPGDLATILQNITVLALPVIFAVTLHEAAHGFVANWLGDDTAMRMGRVTLNPIRHIDLFGTIIMPLLLLFTTRFMFGYAKPVPVNFNRLRNPRRDMVWVALAGPGTNILLAIVSALLVHLLPYVPGAGRDWLEQNLIYSVQINVILAVFNMIPLPPLDGGRVAVGLLPDKLAFPLARTERYGILILLAALFVLPVIGSRMGVDLNFLGRIMEWPVSWVIHLIAWLTGNT